MKGSMTVSFWIRLNKNSKRKYVRIKDRARTIASCGPKDVYALRYGTKWEFVGQDLTAALDKLNERRAEGRKGVLGTLPTSEAPRVPDKPSPAETLASYLAFLRTTTKRNGRKYNERSIKSREANILEFVELIGKPYVEQYDRADMLRYKALLYSQGKVNDTVLNKLMVVVTWLKHNPLKPITGLLKPEDWPLKKKTKPRPFRKDEIDAQMALANGDKLLLRFAYGTGMRKGELAHAERGDIDLHGKFIHVDNKPKWNWETKTTASIRDIPLGDDLIRDLLALPEGLLFPAKNGRPDEHIDRRFEEARERAGAKSIPGEKADPCHRWRDTFATALVRSKKLDLRDVARLMGHEDLQTMDLYAEFVRMESAEARAAANVLDQHGEITMAVAAD
jgi:integrase